MIFGLQYWIQFWKHFQHNPFIHLAPGTVSHFLRCSGLTIVEWSLDFPYVVLVMSTPVGILPAKQCRSPLSIISALKDERFDSQAHCSCHGQNAVIDVQLYNIGSCPSRSPDFCTIGNTNTGACFVCDIWVSYVGDHEDYCNTRWHLIVWYRRFGGACNHHLHDIR
jgi:hypothetical protein